MKKILFSLIALVCGMSINAQIIEVYKGETLVATYKANKADRVVFKEAPVVESPFSWTVGNSIALMDGTNHSMYNYVSGDGNSLSSFALADGQTAVSGDVRFAVYPYMAGETSRPVTQAEAEAAAGDNADRLERWRDYIDMDAEFMLKDELEHRGYSEENQAIILAYLKGENITVPGLQLDGTSIKNVIIPAEQVATADAADSRAVVKVAKLDGESLVFTDVCAYVKVTPQFDCRAIALTSKGSEQIAGKVTIDYGDSEPTTTVTDDGTNTVYLVGTITAGDSYYIAVRPEALTSGYTIEFLTADKGTYYAQSTDDVLELECGGVNDLGEFETTGTWTYNIPTHGEDNGHSWRLITPEFKIATSFAENGRVTFADIPSWGANWVLPAADEMVDFMAKGYIVYDKSDPMNTYIRLVGAGVLKYAGDDSIYNGSYGFYLWSSTPGENADKQTVIMSDGTFTAPKTNMHFVIYKYTK